MRGKTGAIIVIVIVVCIFLIFNFTSDEKDIPAVTNDDNNLIDDYREDCTTVTARELNENIYFEIVEPENTPLGIEFSDDLVIGNKFNENQIYLQNTDGDSSNSETISHDPPPEYKQSAQTFTVMPGEKDEQFCLTGVSIKLAYFSSGAGSVYCDIRHTEGNYPRFYPAEDSIATTNLFDNGGSYGKFYWNFTFDSPVLLESEMSYCFVIRIPGRTIVKSVDYGESYYYGGHHCFSTNGNNWIIDEDNDLANWIIYGYTFAEEKPPEPEKPEFFYLYSDFLDDQCIILYDKITSIKYYQFEDFTKIGFTWHPNKNTDEHAYYNFQGDITQDYKIGDSVEITLHLNHMEFESSVMKFNIDVFDEQWNNKQYFIDNIIDDNIETGLTPINPYYINCPRGN